MQNHVYDMNVEAKQKTRRMRTNRKRGEEMKDAEVCKRDHAQKALCSDMKILYTMYK